VDAVLSLVELVEVSWAGGEIAGGKINAEREITTTFSNDEARQRRVTPRAEELVAIDHVIGTGKTRLIRSERKFRGPASHFLLICCYSPRSRIIVHGLVWSSTVVGADADLSLFNELVFPGDFSRVRRLSRGLWRGEQSFEDLLRREGRKKRRCDVTTPVKNLEHRKNDLT